MKDNESILKRYTGGKAAIDESLVENDAEPLDDLGSFGWLRGIRDRAIMLELRHKDGTITAHSYAWLEKAEFDPSDGITLHFGGKTVRITGRNLNAESRPNVRLFSGIARHRVPWIQEADGPTQLDSPVGATVIEAIEI